MFNVNKHHFKLAKLGFDASTVAPSAPLEAVPTGWYVGMMTASETKPNSKKDGSFLEVEFTIAAPEQYKGRKLFDRMNLENKNAQAVEIAYATLSAICHAVGVIQVEDSAQLHNRPLQIRAVLTPAGPGADGKHYEAMNEIRGYKALETGSVNTTVTSSPVPPPVAQSNVTLPPPVVAQPPVATAPPVTAAPPTVATPAAPAAATPAAPTVPTVAAPPVIENPLEKAALDGWLPHPESAGWFYKGQEVLNTEDLTAKYSPQPSWTAAPVPTAPAVPSVTAAPQVTNPAVAEAAAATPPWMKK